MIGLKKKSKNTVSVLHNPQTGRANRLATEGCDAIEPYKPRCECCLSLECVCTCTYCMCVRGWGRDGENGGRRWGRGGRESVCFRGEWMLTCALLVLFWVFFNVWAEITTEPCVKFVSMVNCCEVSAVCMNLFWGGEGHGGGKRAWGREGRGVGLHSRWLRIFRHQKRGKRPNTLAEKCTRRKSIRQPFFFSLFSSRNGCFKSLFDLQFISPLLLFKKFKNRCAGGGKETLRRVKHTNKKKPLFSSLANTNAKRESSSTGV